YNATIGDLDNDGNKEIYVMVWNMFQLYFVECTGPDTYEMVDSLMNITTDAGIDEGALESIRVADVNSDGINEMYIAGTEPGNTVYVITNISDVSQITAADVKSFHIPRKSGGKLRTLWVADPDQDGLMSLMIGGETNGQIFDLEYKGSGDPSDSTSWNLNIAFDAWEYSGFSPDSTTTISPRFFFGSPAEDMDNDGKNEYVFVNYSTDFGVWKDDAYVWVLEAEKGSSSTPISLEAATEVQKDGAIATGLVYKQGRWLKDGQTIWFCGVNTTTKFTYPFRSTDGGATFTQVGEIEGRAAMMDAIDDQIALIATAEGKIWKTDDGGANWYEAYMYTDPGWFDGIRVINDSVVIAYGDGTSGNGMHLIRSEDKGDMWDEVQGVDFLTAYEGMYTYGTQMINIGDTVWITSTDYTHGFVSRSYDAGLTWETFEEAESGTRIYSIAFIDSQRGLALGSENLCVATTDGGETWSTINPPADFDVYGFVHVPGTQAIIIAGSKMLPDSSYSSAASYTTDLGQTWTEITVPATETEKDIELIGGVFKNANTGYIFSYNGQVYKINGTFPGGVTDVDESELIVIAKDKWLQQNYPNPFNPSTTIRFSLPKADQVKLVIYDALGRKVETLRDEMMEAGQHEIVFTADNYPSGIYFYTLQAGSKTESKKMLLLK
ncbi:MAG: T9SS type A sorting domain-containing protein, partial [Candidatus Delongbacteria bacterium]|nr:T9SS type A sorting domain-containing protein [Candidatus Delongbacteria bacterium]